MSAESCPLISVVPKNKLFIQVSRDHNEGRTTVKLKNLTNAKVHYKLESTASGLYYFKPRYGCLDPKQESLVDVFLLSFDRRDPANRNHELIVQSMLGKIEKEEDYPQLFENTKKAQILTHRVKCIPYECGTLAIEQYQELLFEGSFQLPFSSNISLHNFNYDTLYFKVDTLTTNLSVFPCNGAVNGNDSTDLIVIRKPLTLTDPNAINETITIWESRFNDILEGYPVQRKYTKIKCVYNTPKTTSSVTNCKLSISDLRNVD